MKLALYAILTLSVAVPVQAQSLPKVVGHLGVEDGLPVDSVSSVVVDKRGFLWIATHGGLARYDGQQLKIFDAAGSSEMPGNSVLKLHRDAGRNVYGLSANRTLLRIEPNRIERVRTQSGRALERIRFIQAAPLCVTHPSGVACADDQGRFVERMSFTAEQNVIAALAGHGGDTWILSGSRGIWLKRAGELTLVLRDDSLRLPREQAFVDGHGDLWAVLERGLVHVRRDGRVDTYEMPHGRAADIIRIQTSPDGKVWLGTDVGLFSVESGRVVRASTDTDDTSVDPDEPTLTWHDPQGRQWLARGDRIYRDGRLVMRAEGSIQDLYFDRSGAIWVCTLRDGLYVLLTPRIELLDRNSGLLDDNIYGVDRAADGAIWLGSLGGGVQKVDRDGRITHYGVRDGLPGPNTWAVASAPDRSVYAASYDPGLYRMPHGGTRFLPVALAPVLAGTRVLSISFDAAGRLWLGTERGAWRRDGSTWINVWPGLGAGVAKSILHATDGTTWIGSDRGLWHLSDGRATAVAPDALGQSTVRGLFQDDRGDIWASTEGRGLVYVSRPGTPGTRVVRLGRRQGLPSDSPHGVVQDKQGDYWINSNQGVLRITRSELADYMRGRVSRLSPRRLGIADGVGTLEGNGGVQPAATVDDHGRIVFPTQRGVVRFDPGALPPSAPPRPYIDATTGADGDSFGPASDRNRSIGIHYGAIDLKPGANVSFRYRLLPTQPDWVDAGSQRSAAFLALPPGHHTFELVAGNEGGAWSKTPVRRSFYLPPRWYETGYYELVLLALTALLSMILVRYRTRVLRAQAAVLDATVEARTAELAQEKAKVEHALVERQQAHAALARTNRDVEESNRRLATQAERLEAMDAFRSRLLANVSHELRTPLMLVDLSLHDLADSGLGPPQRTPVVQALAQTQRLNILIEQLIGLAQAEAGQVRLRYTKVDICRFVRDAASALRPATRERGDIGIAVQCEAGEITAFIDTTRITTVLNNLVDNACRYAPAGSEVRIRVGLVEEGSQVRIAVSDRGPGFPPELAEHLFERFYRCDEHPRSGRDGLGIGLALARELVDLHGGGMGAEAQPGRGATFWFELPLGTTHIGLDDVAWDRESGTSAAASPPSLPATVDADARSHRSADQVAIVEDHPDLCAYLRERISMFVPVVAFATMQAALRDLPHGNTGLILIDVVLPDGSGIDLCRRLRSDERMHGTPALLMSAKATPEDILAGKRAGAAEFLVKPFTFNELVAAIVRSAPSLRKFFEPRSAPPNGTQPDPILQAATEAMTESTFGVSDWADRIHLSERQLRRRVIDLTGQSPQAWLREQRLQEVHRLMRDGSCRTLAEAGARSGLENPNYLYRLYRERFGGIAPRNHERM